MLQRGDDPQRLRIVVKAAIILEAVVERPLPGMPERRMAKVVRQRQRLGQILVDAELARQRASDLHDLGFNIIATKGTAAAIADAGIPVKLCNKVKDGRPHIADMIKAGEVQLVFTTVDETRTAIADSRYIRTAAIANRVTYYTTMAGCEAATEALKHEDDITVVSLQELHAELP